MGLGFWDFAFVAWGLGLGVCRWGEGAARFLGLGVCGGGCGAVLGLGSQG